MNLDEKRRQQVIDLCCGLIRVKSYSGEEKNAVERMKQAFIEIGYDEVFIDSYGSITGVIKGNRPGKKILFDGHIDTVPVIDGGKWKHDPFGGVIEDGRIFGRGASDMKGSVSAMICAAGCLAKDTGKDFAGEIYVSGVVHEECFEGIAAREISKRIKPDYVVIGEASELNLKIGQRGRAEIVVETFGKPAHSANPSQGINAVYKFGKLMEKILTVKSSYHNILGYGICELTDIKSSPYPGASVVPDYCRATYDRRLLVGETCEGVLKPIQEAIHEMEKEDPEFKAAVNFASGKEACYTGNLIEGERFFPGWLMDENAEFIKKILNGLKSEGLDSKISTYSFCTNGSHYAGEAGIKTIGFGPSAEKLAHTDDEYIEIEQLIKAEAGYYSILESLLGD